MSRPAPATPATPGSVDVSQPRVFLSHAHEDKPLARAIADGLIARGVRVWLDEAEVRIGDSLIEQISAAIADGDFLIAIVSPDSLESSWCQRELALAAARGINEKRVIVLPVRYRGAEMPAALIDRLWIDADGVDVQTLVERLARDIGRHRAEMTAPFIDSTAPQRVETEAEGVNSVDPARSQPAGTEAPADSLGSKLDVRIAEIDAEFGIRSFFFIAVAPTSPTEAITFSRESGVREVLEQPPFSRYNGWNLVTLDHAQLIRGTRLSVTNAARKQVDLYRDGTFLAFGAVPAFLAWNRRDRPDKLNSLALVEFVHDTLLVYERIVADLDPSPSQLLVRLGVRHALADTDAPLYIPYGRIDRMDYELDYVTEAAPEDATDVELRVDVSPDEPRIDVGVTSYRLLTRVYNWFGFPDEAVPYTNDARTAIDIEQIKQP